MDDMPDAELLDLYLRSGEMGHFDALVKRHIGKARAMIFSMVLNDADADELTQEAFLRVVQALPAFEKRASFSTWLYRIAMNVTHTFLSRRNRNPVEIREDPPESVGQAHESPTQTAMLREDDVAVTRALRELPPRLRSAITLVCIHGFSVKEAAAAEGCLTATLYWRVHQARKRLRATLAVKDEA